MSNAGPEPVLQRLGLPGRWAGRSRFVVLDTRFELERFIDVWLAWRLDPAACSQLHFIARAPCGERPEEASVSKHIPRASTDSAQRDHVHDRDHDGEALRSALRRELLLAWPPDTPDLHHVALDAERVHLWLSRGVRGAWLNESVATVDAFVLHPERGAAAAPAPAAIGTPPHWIKALTRLAAPEAALLALNAPRSWAGALRTAGFEMSPADDSRLEIEPVSASASVPVPAQVGCFAPRYARAAPALGSMPTHHPAVPVLILGAGLAGCATAWALAVQGQASLVIDGHAEPAQEASGNPAGLFHGIVNAHDGVHARFNRSASWHAREAARAAMRAQAVAGHLDGLLRLETRLTDVADMQRQIAMLGLPPEYVQALSAEQASRRSGLNLAVPAWLFASGGWVDPAGLARSFLARAGSLAQFRGGRKVCQVRRRDGRWQALNAASEIIAESPTLVLANAWGALDLLGATGWPVEKVRGQISLWPHDGLIKPPKLPVSGSGYLLPLVDGSVVFGATAQAHDEDPDVRHTDHRRNLDQLSRLTGQDLGAVGIGSLRGRVAWRMVSSDRLPLVGAMPDLAAVSAAGASRAALDLRRLPRQEGLHVHLALGSRGITWAALCAQVVAAGITGAPQPLEASLLDAIDPGRFVVRQQRKPPRPED